MTVTSAISDTASTTSSDVRSVMELALSTLAGSFVAITDAMIGATAGSPSFAENIDSAESVD